MVGKSDIKDRSIQWQPRVIIVGRYSQQGSGESALTQHYFRGLRVRGIETWLVVREFGSKSLRDIYPHENNRLFIFRHERLERFANQIGKFLPQSIGWYRFSYKMLDFYSQWVQRKLIRNLVNKHNIDIVHQVVPVCPKEPSLIYGVGAPVVIGPLNGALDLPPGFSYVHERKKILSSRLRRIISIPFNWLFPGKRKAMTILVANKRTQQALPGGVDGEVLDFVENGVDLSVWSPPLRKAIHPDNPTRFVFLGRLVPVKAIDLLLEAMKCISDQIEVRVQIIGNGEMLVPWQQLSKHLGLTNQIEFTGWLSQKQCAQQFARADVLVFPSLADTGGTAILEAMTMGLPVIATNWGGPPDYLDETCGILIEPINRQQYIKDLAAAMLKLARSPELRQKLGEAGRQRVLRYYDWERKFDHILEIYARTIQRTTKA